MHAPNHKEFSRTPLLRAWGKLKENLEILVIISIWLASMVAGILVVISLLS